MKPFVKDQIAMLERIIAINKFQDEIDAEAYGNPVLREAALSALDQLKGSIWSDLLPCISNTDLRIFETVINSKVINSSVEDDDDDAR